MSSAPLPLGFDELVRALDAAVSERRARPGAVYLLMMAPGSKFHKSFVRDGHPPTIAALRDELSRCRPRP